MLAADAVAVAPRVRISPIRAPGLDHRARCLPSLPRPLPSEPWELSSELDEAEAGCTEGPRPEGGWGPCRLGGDAEAGGWVSSGHRRGREGTGGSSDEGGRREEKKVHARRRCEEEEATSGWEALLTTPT